MSSRLYAFTVLFISLVSLNLAANEAGTAKAYLKMFPAGDFVADIKGMQGSVTVNGDSYSAKNITLDLNTLKTGMEVRDNHAKDKYLEVKKFPTVTLVEATGTGGKGTGKIKIKEKVNTVSGTYTVDAAKKALTAEFRIKLSEFGIEGISYRGLGVEDEAKIVVVAPIAEAAAVPAKAIAPAKPASKVAPKAPVKTPAKPTKKN